MGNKGILEEFLVAMDRQTERQQHSIDSEDSSGPNNRDGQHGQGSEENQSPCAEGGSPFLQP